MSAAPSTARPDGEDGNSRTEAWPGGRLRALRIGPDRLLLELVRAGADGSRQFVAHFEMPPAAAARFSRKLYALCRDADPRTAAAETAAAENTQEDRT